MKEWEKGWTLIELLVVMTIVAIFALMIFVGINDDGWMNKPLKEMTIKDLIILKFIFD